MQGKDTRKNHVEAQDSIDDLDNPQVRYRLRTLLELALRIGRREGILKDFPPIAKDIQGSDDETRK